MAQTPTTNYHLHLGGTSFHVQLISTTRSNYLGQFQDILSTRQGILAFIVAVLLNFLQVKFQGKAESPFETHPRTTLLAIGSLLVYCLAYDAKLRIFRNDRHPLSSNVCRARNIFICSIMAIFGPLSLASIISILVPQRLCPLPFSLAMLFALCQLPPYLIKTIWNWLKEFIRNKFCVHESQRRTTTGLVGLTSARLPGIREYPTIDQIDLIPV